MTLALQDKLQDKPDLAAKPRPEQVVLDISGMTCAACAGRVENALAKAPGVSKASVNLALERADIAIEPGGADADALVAAVERAGYGAQARSGSVAERRLAEQQREARDAATERRDLYLLILSAALTLPLLMPMLAMPFGLHLRINPWLELALATPVQFVVGARFYRGAWKALRPAPATWTSWSRSAPARPTCSAPTCCSARAPPRAGISTSKGRLRSSPSSCSASGWRRAASAAPPPPSARCCGCGRKWRTCCAVSAKSRCRSRICASAISWRCDRASASRWTAL